MQCSPALIKIKEELFHAVNDYCEQEANRTKLVYYKLQWKTLRLWKETSQMPNNKCSSMYSTPRLRRRPSPIGHPQWPRSPGGSFPPHFTSTSLSERREIQFESTKIIADLNTRPIQRYHQHILLIAYNTQFCYFKSIQRYFLVLRSFIENTGIALDTVRGSSEYDTVYFTHKLICAAPSKSSLTIYWV